MKNTIIDALIALTSHNSIATAIEELQIEDNNVNGSI